MRGPVGTSIKLTIRRKNIKKAIEFEVERKIIEVKSVKAKLIGKKRNIAYVRLKSFNENSDSQLIDNIKLFESKNDYGNFYILTRNARGDLEANTQKVIFLAGTGIWAEFVGADCMGAYSGTKESHFMWKGKCKVPDSVMKNVKEKMRNFKK